MRLLLTLFVLAYAHAQSQIVLRVNDEPPAHISPAGLTKLPQRSALLNDHGRQVSYEGVLLRDVLAMHGLDVSNGLRGKQLSSYVVAIADDGYEAVYALAELDPSIVDSDIVVANKREGQPLPANEGPLRIIVPRDKRPARSVRLLREIDVIQLKR